MPRQSSHLLFLCISLTLSLLPLRVLPAHPPTSCPEPAGQQGGENGGLEELLHVEDILSDDPQL